MRRKTIDDVLAPKPKRSRKADAEITWREAWSTIFAEWFDGPTWTPWLTVGLAIFGEAMTDEEFETFKRFTNRTVAPDRPAREVWLACGRRSGKNWFCAAIVVFLACFRKHELKPGDLGRIMLLAVDQDQASEAFRYTRELIYSIPACAAMVVRESTKYGLLRLELNNRIEILIKPADKRRVRGRTLLAAICDEIAFWWNDDISANPDNEVIKALKPAMLGIKAALLIACSSTYARKGTLWEAYVKHFGKDNDRVLVWQAATWEMRPDTSEEFQTFLAEQKADDPIGYESEYGAQFRKDLESYTSIEAVEAVTIQGRSWLAYDEGGRFYAFLDPAGGRGIDSAALCIARAMNDLAVVCRLIEWRSPFSPTAIAPEIIEVMQEYHLTKLFGDNYSGGTWADILKDAAKKVAYPFTYTISEKHKSDIYHDLMPLLNGKRVELLDPTTGLAQDRALKQLVALERTTSRQGKDSISHPRGAMDDLANVMSGALLLAGIRKPSGAVVASHTQSWLPRPMTRPRSDRTAPWRMGDEIYRAPWENDR